MLLRSFLKYNYCYVIAGDMEQITGLIKTVQFITQILSDLRFL